MSNINSNILESKIPVNIEDEMKSSYLDYAMSVIIGRALPDVRDGLKPVHRRIMFTMHDTGNHHNKPYRKAARIVGDVMGQFHPHGDAAIYDAIVRMVQEFSLRYPLVDGQGNFGSIDGDPAAAYRYTEVRMARIAHEMLADIEKDTVDFQPNYDDSRFEPRVLPTRIPNLLINGSSGIAVGMATNIPPHNLSEVCDGLIALIDDPSVTIDELIRIIPGPDFPTAAIIHGREGINEAYRIGKGKVSMRARILTERNSRNDRESIIISELPYMVNKARMIEEIAQLVRDKKIEGIADLRDESDKDGIRVVIELKRDEIAGVIINQLYKNTQLQSSFGIIMLSLVDNQPKVLNLKEMLELFLQFRREVVTRRTQYELTKAEERAHILEGLKIALDELDDVIDIIRTSKTVQEASARLQKRFEMSDKQANAILEMRLQRLTGMERQKIEEEYAELIKQIAYFQEILGNERLLWNLIREELIEIKDKYGDERRTEIVEETGEMSIEDLIVEEDMVVTISHAGYIKRNPLSLYRAQRRGGKGKIGMETREEDFVNQLFVASTHDYILVFTDAGRVYWIKVHQLPQVGRASKGKAIVNLLNLQDQKEKMAAVLPIREFSLGKSILMATKKGIIKKTDLMAFSHPRSNGIIAITIDDDDELIAVELSDGAKDIFLGTRNGQSIRFKEDQVRQIGRQGRGVKGVSLGKGDYVVGMELVSANATLLAVTENGYGKRTDTAEYRVQGRGGSGVINIKTTERNGKVVGFCQVTDEDEMMLITDGGIIIRLRLSEVRTIGRNTQGIHLIELGEGQKVVSIARLAEKAED